LKCRTSYDEERSVKTVEFVSAIVVRFLLVAESLDRAICRRNREEDIGKLLTVQREKNEMVTIYYKERDKQ